MLSSYVFKEEMTRDAEEEVFDSFMTEFREFWMSKIAEMILWDELCNKKNFDSEF